MIRAITITPVFLVSEQEEEEESRILGVGYQRVLFLQWLAFLKSWWKSWLKAPFMDRTFLNIIGTVTATRDTKVSKVKTLIMESYHWGGSTTRVVGVGTTPPLLSMFSAASLAMSLNLDVNLASTGCFLTGTPLKS